jgi:hypothetical protein
LVHLVNAYLIIAREGIMKLRSSWLEVESTSKSI